MRRRLEVPRVSVYLYPSSSVSDEVAEASKKLRISRTRQFVQPRTNISYTEWKTSTTRCVHTASGVALRAASDVFSCMKVSCVVDVFRVSWFYLRTPTHDCDVAELLKLEG